MLHSPLRAHVWGVKGIGSQGDGCAQLLCKSAADLTAAVALVGRDFPQMSCLPLFIGSTKPVTQVCGALHTHTRRIHTPPPYT